MKRKSIDKRPLYTLPSKVMTVREVSAYLRVHPSTIYRLLKQQQIPAFQMGSDWRFNIEAIDSWRLKQESAGG
ncbi:MAG TPA: helix-turn-helix domain-containing protein [Candidatus Binataceae bacterium]|nr:helix-turn-helix domain-containing protein [Candidatus Binataceae bacterium]